VRTKHTPFQATRAFLLKTKKTHAKKVENITKCHKKHTQDKKKNQLNSDGNGQ